MRIPTNIRPRIGLNARLNSYEVNKLMTGLGVVDIVQNCFWEARVSLNRSSPMFTICQTVPSGYNDLPLQGVSHTVRSSEILTLQRGW